MTIPASRSRFELRVPVVAEDFDELGHVNNVVYLRWIQDIATAHWRAAATPAQQERYAWVAHRHEIDYKLPGLPGGPSDPTASVVLWPRASSARAR